ncbi:hypothetical protein AMELA_G00227670 [Ameiurus melas]|uniref:EGF-like domain-containing protein n=1 Tax=Ameiurus melas TaxID=219545 RepID=A0A7J6A0E3_AMEME|nr:hypothetical protein AMELA_G00227670 [Ameiurus melas]
MKRNMGFCSACWISVVSALLALLLIPLDAQANSVLGNMTETASPSNSTSVLAESDGVKLDDEMSKPISNMFLILRSGRKPRGGEELGSGLQEGDHLLPSTLSPKEMIMEDSKISPDSQENDHLLPAVTINTPLPSASTENLLQGTEDLMGPAVVDLDETSNLNRQEPSTAVTTFPSHSPSNTAYLTVDYYTRSPGNVLVPPAPTEHELQGREPTAWTMPNKYPYHPPYSKTVPPSSEIDTTKTDEYDDELTTTPTPPPPRTFHPHFPNPFIPARGKEPPTNRNKKFGKSSSAECQMGSVLVNGTCKSQCDMMPNYCFNGGQCFVLEGSGVFCRCNIQDYVWHKGARCESVITEFQVMCIAIGTSVLTVLLLFMIVVCFAKKLHVLKTENNKLRKRSSSKYRPSSEQHNDNFSLSTIAEGSNPNDDPNSQNKLEDAVKSPPPKEDESLNIQNSLTPKHENHKVLGEENSSEVNSLQNNMM